MKKLIIIVISLIILLLIAFLIKEKFFAEENKIIHRINKTPTFKIISPTLKKDKDILIYYNDIEPYLKLQIYSKEQGYIKKLFFDIADKVQKDENIAEIDNTELLEEQKGRQASLNSAKSSLIKNIIETKHKKLIFDRAKQAYLEELIPVQELDDTKYNYQASKTNEKLMQNKIDEASASLKQIEIKLNNTKVTSPINGIISKRLVEEGTLVKANELLFEILKVNKLKLKLHIPEYEIKKVFDKNFKIKKDITFSIFIPSIEKKLKADPKTIYPIIDAKSKTINIELVVNNKYNIKPGLSCTITLNNEGSKKIFIPKEAALYDEINDKYYIQIVKENKIYKTNIIVEREEKKELIVKQGLSINNKLILPFIASMKDGESIISKNKY